MTSISSSLTGVISVMILLLAAGSGVAQATPSNWSGDYPPCDRHADLLESDHVDLGVRILTSNPVLARQFALAMEFWTGVLDLAWHKVNSQHCSIELVDGTPELFDRCACISARSQFPDRPGFEGWIAFNPGLKLNKQEMFLDSVHELGHLLGLPHNPSSLSVMFFFGLDKAASLDGADLDALAVRHKLRADLFEKGGMTEARVRVPSPPAAGRGWFRAKAGTAQLPLVQTPGRP